MTDFLPPTVMHLLADISDYVGKLAEADAALQTFVHNASGHLDTAVADMGREGERAGKTFEDAVPRGAKDTGERVVSEVTGRLRDERGRFTKEGEEAGKEVGHGLSRALSALSSALGGALSGAVSGLGSTFSGLGSAASGAVSVLTSMAFIIPVLVGAAASLAPVISAAVAALAALPAAATAGAGALATLALGFHGLSSAIGGVFAPAAAGAAQSMSQVANAEWNLQQAQKQSIATQVALSDARHAAVQNIKDLALAMSGAKLNVEEAELAVKDADLAYRQAFATGNQDQIYRTSLALRQAQQNLAEAQNGANKATEASVDANARGVEGSKQVQAALDAQTNATHSLQQAQEALTQAQKGSGGAASALATALAALAPSARAFVLEIQKLKPELQGIQQTVQQHMFAGLAGDLDQLAHAWIPGARVGLTALADDFNKLFHGIMQGLASPAVVSALAGLFASFHSVFSQFASLAPGLVTVFAELVKAATPFLQMLGEGGVGGLKNFIGWIDKLASNGTLQQFFTTAGETLKMLGGMLKDAGSILMSVFQAMGTVASAAGGPLGILLHQLAEFFNSASGAQALSTIFKVLGQVADILGGALAGVLPILAQIINALGPALTPILAILNGQFLPIVLKLAEKLADALVPIIQALGPALDQVLTALMPLLDMLGGALGDILVALAPVIAQIVTMMGQELAAALVALTPIFQQLLPVLVQLIQQLLPALLPLLLSSGRLFMALLPALTPLIELLVNILVPILKVLTPVLVFVAEALGYVANAMIDGMKPIIDFIGWLVKGLDSASMWKAVGRWFVDLWKDISGAFMDGVHWIGQRWDDFIGLAKSIPGRVTGAIGDFATLLWDKGKDLVTGLWNGILSMGKWLADKVVGFVKDFIPGPIAKALGMNSPSRVAADLARNVPTGLALGMDEASHHVVSAATRLATAMLPNAGNIGALGLPTYTLPPAAPLLPPVGAGQPGNQVIELHVHTHNYLDSRELHAGLMPVAQQFRLNNGTTGLETPPSGPGVRR